MSVNYINSVYANLGDPVITANICRKDSGF